MASNKIKKRSFFSNPSHLSTLRVSRPVQRKEEKLLLSSLFWQGTTSNSLSLLVAETFSPFMLSSCSTSTKKKKKKKKKMERKKTKKTPIFPVFVVG
jgi:hypothetical protein